MPNSQKTPPIALEDAACRWAATVRDTCLRAALDAFEQAGLGGMCAEGRWEMAVDAMRSLDLTTLIHELAEDLISDEL